MKSFKQHLITALMGAFVLGLLASAPAKAESNPFVAQDVAFSADFDAGDKEKEKGKCGEGKCGEGKKKEKCGEGKCGEGKKKEKCGEGKCGEGKKKEGKCGE
ncbi:HvfA family oxazolone/thioamide-modified RiPP metallophore [Thalassotalea litorea]|uniref:HvfA family oxazolone/thioamide-modified RiPP metallophore n=1 Tax=Thalassotalea litorea TaxID=2020715 RepID=UPI0037364A34